MSNQHSVVLAEWTQARVSEIDAVVQAAENGAKELRARAGDQADELIADLKNWRTEYINTLQKMQRQDQQDFDASWQYLETIWGKFEGSIIEWIEVAQNETEAFEALQRAHQASWRNALTTMQTHLANADAEHKQKLQKIVDEAQIFNCKIQTAFENATTSGWSAMKNALDESRAEYEKIIRKTAQAHRN